MGFKVNSDLEFRSVASRNSQLDGPFWSFEFYVDSVKKFLKLRCTEKNSAKKQKMTSQMDEQEIREDLTKLQYVNNFWVGYGF